MPVYNYDYQIRLADKLMHKFDRFRNIILSCPCGYGKSGVAYQLHVKNASRGGRTLVLNHNKILVDQYEKLFAGMPEIVCIKGKSNYPCSLETNTTCDCGKCQTTPNYNCIIRDSCQYYALKDDFSKLPLAVTNYQFVLSNLDTDHYSRQGNNLLICDECHNLDAIISGYRKVLVNSEFIRCITLIAGYIQKYRDNSVVNEVSEILSIYSKINEDNYTELFDTIYSNLREIISHFKAAFEDDMLRDSHVMITINELSRYLTTYLKYKSDSDTEYVFSLTLASETEFEYSLTPLTVGHYFPEILSSITDKSLLMSGTIVNPDNMMKNLGLSRDDTLFLDVPSIFDKRNRPVLFCNVAPLNMKNSNTESDEFRAVIDAILSLLSSHSQKQESGVIFTPSYKLAKDVFFSINRKATQLGYTILMNSSSEDSYDTLQEFTKRKGLRLLISPSFEEGVNFNDDISRFQIIVKTPYLFIGDNRINRKMQIDRSWYNSSTFCRIIQSASRSVRSKDDYAVTYVLDSNATKLYKSVKSVCPSWFNEAVEIL